MTARLTFRSAVEYEPGTVYAILAECYTDILDGTLQDNLMQFDHEVFAAPDTVGACAFISSVDRQSVGFFSYDPRQGPQIGIVGHNGVLPPFQRKGYGTEQILEILRLFTLRHFARAQVTTSEHPFFFAGPQDVRDVQLSRVRQNPCGQPKPVRTRALRTPADRVRSRSRMTTSQEVPPYVIPAKAGIHLRRGVPGPLLSQG